MCIVWKTGWKMGKSQELLCLDNSVINEIIHNLYQFCQRKTHILLHSSIYDVVTMQALINLPNTFINDKSRYVCGLVDTFCSTDIRAILLKFVYLWIFSLHWHCYFFFKALQIKKQLQSALLVLLKLTWLLVPSKSKNMNFHLEVTVCLL